VALGLEIDRDRLPDGEVARDAPNLRRGGNEHTAVAFHGDIDVKDVVVRRQSAR
jgi:hypothetical protein